MQTISEAMSICHAYLRWWQTERQTNQLARISADPLLHNPTIQTTNHPFIQSLCGLREYRYSGSYTGLNLIDGVLLAFSISPDD
jgi:hypothetical protein